MAEGAGPLGGIDITVLWQVVDVPRFIYSRAHCRRRHAGLRTGGLVATGRLPMTFRLLHSIDVSDGSTLRRIGLYEGELTTILVEHKADILVVSAFPNDYTPSETSLIGGLERMGLSIGQLAAMKAHDLRVTCAFWLSQPITGPATGMNIRQAACFEPVALGPPATVVGNLFRGLSPFLDDRKSQVVAMPLLAAGDQGFPSEIMLRAILDAAVDWLARGLAISELKIVERNPTRAVQLASVMADFKSKLTATNLRPLETGIFDVFLSFSSEDSEAADIAKTELIRSHAAKESFRLSTSNRSRKELAGGN